MSKTDQLRLAKEALSALLQSDENHRNWVAINDEEKAQSLAWHLLQDSLRFSHQDEDDRRRILSQAHQAGQARVKALRIYAEEWVAGARAAYEAEIAAIMAA